MDRKFNKNQHQSQKKIQTMKFSALSVAAIFAFFAQTMAEPQTATTTSISACVTPQVFHCKSFIIFQSTY